MVLGDQLSRRLSSFQGFDKERDAVWMAEVHSESEYVWTSKPRIVMFLAAMRQFRDELLELGYRVHYRELNDKPEGQSLATALKAFLRENSFDRVVVTLPGEHRLMSELSDACEELGVPVDMHEDSHFLCSRDEFEEHAKGRKQLRMEYFYRELRKRHDILMDDGKPAQGKWNFDSSNRESFGKEGPENLLGRRRFRPNATTNEVIKLVEERFREHPGKLDTFDWPISRKEARVALKHFIEDELTRFGKYQDAMWTGEPYLHHSLLSSALNLKLLDPLEVIEAAETAYRKGDAPIESVEGFIRQILGWREYVRGVYWLYMPEYLERNALDSQEALPDFYWTGNCKMTCLKETIGQTLKYGYAHHIQRLMVTGLYALLLGVDPRKVHEWYLAVYVDAVEWVELPNTLGMSQFADGGTMASKPYVATGKYIRRMSNYCQNCEFNPEKRTGKDACPFTTLYWDFLTRHRDALSSNTRMSMQLRNLDRVSSDEMSQIREQAEQIRKNGGNHYEG